MGLFSKKLTPIQQAELQEFTRNLNATCQLCEQAYNDFRSHTIDLYYICYCAIRVNRELLEVEHLVDVERTLHEGDWKRGDFKMRNETVNVNTLIKEAQNAIQVYTDFLTGTQTKVSSLKPAEWYPKKLHKVLDSWASYFSCLLQFLEAPADALQPPEPLKHDPQHGNDKLNVFHSQLHIVYRSHQDLCPKPIPIPDH